MGPAGPVGALISAVAVQSVVAWRTVGIVGRAVVGSLITRLHAVDIAISSRTGIAGVKASTVTAGIRPVAEEVIVAGKRVVDRLALAAYARLRGAGVVVTWAVAVRDATAATTSRELVGGAPLAAKTVSGRSTDNEAAGKPYRGTEGIIGATIRSKQSVLFRPNVSKFLENEDASFAVTQAWSSASQIRRPDCYNTCPCHNRISEFLIGRGTRTV